MLAPARRLRRNKSTAILIWLSINSVIISFLLGTSAGSNDDNSNIGNLAKSSNYTDTNQQQLAKTAETRSKPTYLKHDAGGEANEQRMYVLDNQPSEQLEPLDSFYVVEGPQIQLQQPTTNTQNAQPIQMLRPQLQASFPVQQINNKLPRQYDQQMGQIILHSPDFQVEHHTPQTLNGNQNLMESSYPSQNELRLPAQYPNQSQLLQGIAKLRTLKKGAVLSEPAKQLYENPDAFEITREQQQAYELQRAIQPQHQLSSSRASWRKSRVSSQALEPTIITGHREAARSFPTRQSVSLPMERFSTPMEPHNEPGTGPVSAAEIENILQRLRPLAVNEREKAKRGTRNGGGGEQEEEPEEEEEEEEHEEEVGKGKEEKPGDQLDALKTYRLLEDLMNLRSKHNRPPKEQGQRQVAVDNSTQSSASDDLVFLKSLAELGANLAQQQQQQQTPLKNVAIPDERFYNPELNYQPQSQPEIEQGDATQSGAPQVIQRVVEEPTASHIPIELLVDHLMSGSRLASFGIQHADHFVDPSRVEANDIVGDEAAEEMEDDDEEEDDEDQDNNGTLPIEESESALKYTKISNPNSELSFNSVANSSNTWIPLNNLVSATDKSSAKRGEKDVKSTRRRKKKKKRKKKRKKRRNGRKRKRKKEPVDRKQASSNQVESKSSHDASSIMIGNRLLNRKDLIRLIKILNKMASKKEPSKERDSSRKLLRFLIRLALENHRKTQTDSKKTTKLESKYQKASQDLVGQSLRSILEGPVDLASDRREAKNATVIELKPISEVATNETEVEESDKQPESDEGARKSVRSKSFRDISDDLEQYFDSDFFDDLADNYKVNETIAPEDHVKLATDKPIKRRASHSGYHLPIPIYGQQQIEAADEDDVDLDHVRVLPRIPGTTARRNKGRQARPKIPKRPRRAKKQLGKRDKDEDEDDNEDSDGDAPVKASGTRRRKANGRAPKQPPDSSKKDDHEDEAEEEEEEDAEDGSKSKAGNDNAPTPKERPTSKKPHAGKPPDESPPVQTSRSSRRKRRKSVQNSGKEVDLYTRDEIPAPISDRIKPTHRSKTNHDSTSTRPKALQNATVDDSTERQNEVKPANRRARESLALKQSAKNNVIPKSQRKVHKTVPKTSTSRKPKKKSSFLNPENDEDAHQDDYNEGTSYSNVCDDDGKCQISVKSNNPQIGKAIETNNDTAIVRHLGKWIEDPD